MTVYADILLLVNISMDLLTLYLAGRVTHKHISKTRMIIASLIGGVAATIFTLFADTDGVMKKPTSVLFAFLLSVVMTVIAFGVCRKISDLIRDSVIIWGAGALLGGIMTVIMSLGEPVYLDYGNNFVPAFLLCLMGATAIVRFFTSANSKKIARVTVTVGGQEFVFSAICDSGSFAADPISGKPAIIANSSVLGDVLPMLDSDNCSLRLRVIPISGISGRAVLKGFIPDKTTVDGKDVSAVIAIHEGNERFGGQDGIIPAALCKQ